MVKVQQVLDDEKRGTKIIMQVHDSIVVDCYPGEEQQVGRHMKHALEHPTLSEWGVELDVPLVADIEIGPSWGEKEPMEVV